jgi:hypothetical protein
MLRPRKRKHRENDHMWHSGNAAHEEADGATSLFSDFPDNAGASVHANTRHSSGPISSSHYRHNSKVAGSVANHTFLSLQAYEADVRRGPKATGSASALDWQSPHNTLISWRPYSESTSIITTAQPVPTPFKLPLSHATTTSICDDDDNFNIVPSPRSTAVMREHSNIGHGVLMDRYVRLMSKILDMQFFSPPSLSVFCV